MLAAHKINPYKDITDEELMERFQDGDEKAFNEIVIRYRERIVNFILGMVRDFDKAEDLAQDTFLIVYERKHSYKRIAKLSTWIFTIAKNLTFTELRKVKRRKTYSVSELEPENGSNIIFWQNIEDGDNSFNKSMYSDGHINITTDIIMNKIEELPDDFKIIINLRDIQELSYEEISRIMDLAIGTVKSRLNRARIKLRELLLGEDK
tara:strand:+ start:1016 stop:1636 length:621 start_codon:yes stop_codon:yes gene_type:complete